MQSSPAQSGTARSGVGGWTNSPSTYTYQWDRCATNAGFTFIPCSAIPGATSQTYTLTAADVGGGIRVGETAMTSAGGISAPAASAFTAVVQASPAGSPPVLPSAPVPSSTSAPVNTSPPSITGDALEGQVLAETHGAWSDGPINSYAQQWERCDAAGNNCITIADATARTYLLVSADAGHTIRIADGDQRSRHRRPCVVSANRRRGRASKARVPLDSSSRLPGRAARSANRPLTDTGRSGAI